MNERNKKNIIKELIFIFFILIGLLILIITFKKTYKIILQRNTFENSVISFANNNKNKIFSIDKIVFFSSSDSKNKTGSKTNFTLENLYTYTDIALFINNNSEENTPENTLKNLKITNIKFTEEPKLGNSNLYFKSINNFAKSYIPEENKEENEIQFEVTSDDKTDLNMPVLYNNCANPITLSYINQNIKTDYTITDTENPITYNGQLLKRCNVLLKSIEAEISFDIEIENNKNQKFKTTVYFDIPYEDSEKSIYDGNIIIQRETNFDFYRYE